MRQGVKSYSVFASTKIVAACAISGALLFNSISLYRTNNKLFGRYTGHKELEVPNHRLETDDVHKQEYNQGVGASKTLDFAIIGWPKTGNSFLFKLLGNHPEITMPNKEFDYITEHNGGVILAEWLKNVSSNEQSTSSIPQKYGIKCPAMIKNTKSIENLKQLSDSTRLIVGLRHPVHLFQSFYNYRIRELHNMNQTLSDIVPATKLINLKHWKGVSTHQCRYDLFLKQLAKTSLSMKETAEMIQVSRQPFWEKRITVNPYKIFMYVSDQLDDTNVTRADEFRTDLQNFLGLEAPLPNFNEMPKVNYNSRRYPENIDICDDKYSEVRSSLLENGKKSGDWLLEQFMKSKDVAVSGVDFFIESVKSWDFDPCAFKVVEPSSIHGQAATYAIKRLAHPQTAAQRLQAPAWIKQLRYNVVKAGSGNRRRILEWKVEPNSNSSQNNSGIELFLMPHQFRSSLLIDLFVEGKVVDTMGENVVMMGWAKACLALGCDRVLMFESYKDFVHRIDTESNQFYMVDFKSLPALKDELLLKPILNQRTWELSWWGRPQTGPTSAREMLNITDKYRFNADHALLPFNYTNAPPENVRMAILPTSITMNHIPMQEDVPVHCDVFYMGKSVVNIKNSTSVMELVEKELFESNTSVESVRLCTAFKIPHNSSYEKILGFVPKYTVNVGRMKPTQFAATVGNAKVVVGSGWPRASPSIVDAIFGGAVFIAPSVQFGLGKMSQHPLFIKSDESFSSLEEQAERIVRIMMRKKNQLPFGGFYDTSYSIEHACSQILEIIRRSLRQTQV